MIKKIYKQPISYFIDLSAESGTMQTISQLPKNIDDDVIDNEEDVLTRQTSSIWKIYGDE